MKPKEALLELIESLDQKNFNFEAFKMKALILLQSFFGKDDPKVEMLNKLHYDYSSWSLRDETGSKSNDTVKEQVRGIIQAALIEQAIKHELTEEIIQNKIGAEAWMQLKKAANNAELTEYFSKIAPETKDQILIEIIQNFQE